MYVCKCQCVIMKSVSAHCLPNLFRSEPHILVNASTSTPFEGFQEITVRHSFSPPGGMLSAHATATTQSSSAASAAAPLRCCYGGGLQLTVAARRSQKDSLLMLSNIRHGHSTCCDCTARCIPARAALVAMQTFAICCWAMVPWPNQAHLSYQKALPACSG